MTNRCRTSAYDDGPHSARRLYGSRAVSFGIRLPYEGCRTPNREELLVVYRRLSSVIGAAQTGRLRERPYLAVANG